MGEVGHLEDRSRTFVASIVQDESYMPPFIRKTVFREHNA